MSDPVKPGSLQRSPSVEAGDSNSGSAPSGDEENIMNAVLHGTASTTAGATQAASAATDSATIAEPETRAGATKVASDTLPGSEKTDSGETGLPQGKPGTGRREMRTPVIVDAAKAVSTAAIGASKGASSATEAKAPELALPAQSAGGASFAAITQQRDTERPRWADIPVEMEPELRDLATIMKVEDTIRLLKIGRSGESKIILLPKNFGEKCELLSKAISLFTRLCGMEIQDDPNLTIGTVVNPQIFSKEEKARTECIQKILDREPKARLSCEVIEGLIDAVGALPSIDQLQTPSGAQLVYYWIATLASYYYSEQCLQRPISKSKKVLKDPSKFKAQILNHLMRFITEKEAAEKILNAYEICIRKFAAVWSTQKQNLGLTDHQIFKYFPFVRKTKADILTGMCHTRTVVNEVVVRTKGQKATKETTKTIVVIPPVATVKAPMSLTEKAAIEKFNADLKNEVMHTACPVVQIDCDLDTILAASQKRIDALYKMATQLNTLLRARRENALGQMKTEEPKKLEGQNLQPKTPEESYRLFMVVQAWWETRHQDCKDLVETISKLAPQGVGQWADSFE